MSFGQKVIHKAKFDSRTLLTNFADKVEIKNHVAKLIGTEYVVPSYKVVDNVKDLKIKEFPLEFVLKPSHASGAGFIIHEGAQRNAMPISDTGNIWAPYHEIHPNDLQANEAFIKEKSDVWLRSTYAPGKEYCYAAIPPKLVIEKYLNIKEDRVPHDYRFYTFHGKVKFFRALMGISGASAKFAYDEFGNPLEGKVRSETLEFLGPHPVLPEQFLKMITLAETLSLSVDFVRVDFYFVEGRIYFSEMTNYPFGGQIEFVPKTFNITMSSYWKSFDICSFKKIYL